MELLRIDDLGRTVGAFGLKSGSRIRKCVPSIEPEVIPRAWSDVGHSPCILPSPSGSAPIVVRRKRHALTFEGGPDAKMYSAFANGSAPTGNVSLHASFQRSHSLLFPRTIRGLFF